MVGLRTTIGVGLTAAVASAIGVGVVDALRPRKRAKAVSGGNATLTSSDALRAHKRV